MDKLLPCPFCQEELSGDHRSHPVNGCFLDGFEVGEDWICAWNTRHTPEGWQLVPVEVTQAMRQSTGLGARRELDMWNAWDAMLAAAPKWGGE